MTDRLWVVSELYYPEQTSTGSFLTRIAEGLAGDFDVKVVCGRPTYSERQLKVERREQRHRTEIHRVRSTRFAKDALVGRVVNMVTFTLSAFAFCLWRTRRGDRVLIVTNPPMLTPLIALLTRMRRLKGTLLVHDVYPEVLIATGHLRRGGWLTKIVGALTRLTYRQFADVIVLGRDMEEVVRPKLTASANRLHVIPNWGDVDEIVPMDAAANPFRQLHDLGERAVIQFSGNLGRTHDIDGVLDAARLLDRRLEVTFCFIGYGGKSQQIERRRHIEELSNVLFLPRQPRDMLGPMLASADAAVIAFVDDMFGVSVPSRMYNIMATGTPIIAVAHPRSELVRVVKEERCGWAIWPADANRLADIARSLATPEGRRDAAERGARAREAVVRRFTLPVVLDRFRHVLHGQDEPKTPA